jgi:hypothetical protein
LPLPQRPKPPRAERRLNLLFWPVVALLLAPLVVGLCVGDFRLFRSSTAIGGLGTMLFACGIIYRGARLRIARRFLRPHGAFVCPRCHYPLRRLPDAGVCPECGTGYTRAGVVALWEDRYRLGHIFPRAAPPPASDPSPAQGPAVRQRAVAPWSAALLDEAFEKVERVARTNGFAGARFPIYALEMDRAIAALGRPIPPDLYAFLAWLNPDLWSRLVGRDRAASPPAGRDDASGASFAAVLSESTTDAIRVHPPSSLRSARLEALAGDRAAVRAFIEALPSLGRDSAWLDAHLVEFADTPRGHTICCCVDGPEFARGTIVAFGPASAADVASPAPLPDRIWLGGSLAQWLTRLALMGGIDPALAPDRLAEVPPLLAEPFLEETRGRNPHSPLLVAPPVLAAGEAAPGGGTL